jgi:hypothetical protein
MWRESEREHMAGHGVKVGHERGAVRTAWLAFGAVAMVVAAILVTALVASGDDGSDADVRPLEEIVASDIVFEPDPAGRGIVVRLTTSIDVVCAVSFGPTPALGFVATDGDMAGGGHRDHNPLLPGLEPGTSYHYVLSGVGPDGVLYQSEPAEFTYEVEASATPEAPAPNVAGNARIEDVSSEFSSAFAADHAIDGDLSTEWSSRSDGDDAFIVLAFDAPVQIGGVGFITREMSDGSAVTASILVVVEGETFGPFPVGPGLSIAEFEAVGQTVRIEVDSSTGGNTGAVEIEVYGSVAG